MDIASKNRHRLLPRVLRSQNKKTYLSHKEMTLLGGRVSKFASRDIRGVRPEGKARVLSVDGLLSVMIISHSVLFDEGNDP